FLRQMDEAAFSPTGSLPPEAAQRAVDLYAIVDREALTRTKVVVPALCIIGLLSLGVATANAYDAAAAQLAFDRGIAAYEKHEFVAAREAFIASVAAEPRAPDAWADLGTAAWAVADTARAVAGWQRALRVEPLASDVRERVELVHALPWSSAGFIPAMPTSWLFNLAAFLWCLAWATAAYRANRHRPLRSRDVATVAVAAGLIALCGFGLSDRLSGRNLAVMRETSSLSSDPQLGGERGATAIVGEVV